MKLGIKVPVKSQPGSRESPKTSPNQKQQPKDLNAMIEAQQVADILRANNDLIAMKSFRLQNEKFYKEKELNLLRRKEIREPLEEALTKIEILSERLGRRDEMIGMLSLPLPHPAIDIIPFIHTEKLRRHISLDAIHFKVQDMELTKLRNVDLKDTEHRVEILLDEIAIMNRSADEKANQVYVVAFCSFVVLLIANTLDYLSFMLMLT